MTELPRGWRRVSLADLGTWYGGGTPSKARSDYWSDGTVPWLSPKDMGPEVIRSTQDRITEAAVGGSAVRRVPAGSVALVVRSGILERTIPIAVVPMEVTLNQDMKALVPGPDVDARWVAWGLRSREQTLLRQCRKAGTTVASIETKRLLAQELPVPPLDEQRRIVDILEDHLSRVDAAQALVARGEARLSVWLEVLLEDSLSGDWPQHGIGSIATIGSGATPLKSRRDYYQDGTVPWVTSGALNDSVVTEPTTYITELAVRETAVKMWPAGALLVAMYGEGKTRGRCSELAIPATTNQACAAIVMQPEHSDLQPWLKLVLRSRYQRMRRMASGGVQPNLSLGLIKSMMVPIPAAARRTELLNAVRRADDSATQLRQPLKTVTTRTQALRHSLLTATFSGRLV